MNLQAPAILLEQKPPKPLVMQQVVEALSQCHNVIVVAGAGISTSAGIPDFRSRRGLYTTAPGRGSLDAITAQYNAKHFMAQIDSMKELAYHAEPTVFHQMLGRLGVRLGRLYTQNIDGLETKKASLERSRVIALHGCLSQSICTIQPTHVPCPWI